MTAEAVSGCLVVEIVDTRTAANRTMPAGNLEELCQLASSSGLNVLASLSFRNRTREAATLIGSGKLAELAELAESSDCDLIVVDAEMSPSQKKNFENAIGCPVIGRTELILDLFARRARTSVARQQVELARLEFLLPRLEGGYAHLAASQGGSGFRGPGETQIELDRRQIKKRIATLRERLRLVEKSRHEQRKKRRRDAALIAIAGYTNAGKTTLLNALAREDLPAEDRLFATLDATVRAVYNPLGTPLLFADTVGFIRDLPHSLVEAFKSTLEEVRAADLVLVVFDASEDAALERLAVVEKVLEEIGAGQVPRLYCANKCDRPQGAAMAAIAETRRPLVNISAGTGSGLDGLLQTIHHLLLPKSDTGRNKQESLPEADQR